jgi:hypothetical protein
MKFDKEVEKILSECVITEGVFDFIGGALKSIGQKYVDRIKDAIPITSGAISAGMGAYKKSEEDKKSSIERKDSLSKQVAKEFLIYSLQSNPKKRIKVYGTSYEMSKILDVLTGKINRPVIDNKTIKTQIQLNNDKKVYNDLKKAASLIKNKNLNELNLLNNPSLKTSIDNFIEEKRQLVESYILEKKEIKNDSPKMKYDQITSDDVLKSMANILKVPFSSNHPSYLKQKLQYLFALVNDGQVIR